MTNRTIRAPRGTKKECKGWIQEAAFRMIQNNLDPEVAEKPEELIVYGGAGKAARNWDCFNAILHSLKRLNNDETLLVQSGKPVGILPTHREAPRVLIANSNLVPAWATWDEFRRLEALGLIMYGQMTAGSWIYIGTQGILQGTYETFSSAGQKHFNGDLRGKLILSAGLGGMGGAQPLAATMNGAVFIGVEVDPERIEKRLKTGYVDMKTDSFEKAIELAHDFQKRKEAKSIALLGNAADIYLKFIESNIIPDLVTDQTSAHDTLNGYIPRGLSVQEAALLRKENPKEYIQRAIDSIVIHVQAMLDLQKKGAHVFDYGNNIRGQAKLGGLENAFDFAGFVPAYIRPLFCEGKGPFRWVSLSGDPKDIDLTDQEIMKAFPKNDPLKRWLTLAKEKIQFQGLPSRICWLGYGEREIAGEIFNRLVAKKKIKAPIVIGRDHLDCGSVASPNRETEGMKDGSDAIADWPILNALINAINGAAWVSFHHGGGVGIGYSLHAGMVVVADGTKEASRRLSRVLNSDPATGIIRHADAGYETAIAIARKKKIDIPMLSS